MIGMRAGWPSTIPILPWANWSQTVLRSVPPGLGWVSPDAASCFMKFKVTMFCGLLIAYLPELLRYPPPLPRNHSRSSAWASSLPSGMPYPTKPLALILAASACSSAHVLGGAEMPAAAKIFLLYDMARMLGRHRMARLTPWYWPSLRNVGIRLLTTLDDSTSDAG